MNLLMFMVRLVTKSAVKIGTNAKYFQFSHILYHMKPSKVGNYFANKRWSLGRCSSLADSDHGVCFFMNPSRWVKVKLPLSLPNYTPCHEDEWGTACIEPYILVLGTSCRWVVSFMTRPLYPQEKSPLVPTG
jgi:hypothetical protein